MYILKHYPQNNKIKQIIDILYNSFLQIKKKKILINILV